MAQDVTIAGASYEDVPSIDVPTTGGGTSSFFDVSDTTATAADVASGKSFYLASGLRATGAASYAGAPANNGNANRANAILYGTVDSTSTATVFTATVEGLTALVDGTTVMLHNGVVTSASGFTVNVNGLGAKKCYNNMTNATQDTTIFNVSYTMLFVYSTSLDSGSGGWWIYRGYDGNTNTIGYQLRSNSGNLVASDTGYRYRLWLTSADGSKWVPINTSTSTNATSNRTLNTRPIDPFGPIVYRATNGTCSAGTGIGATAIWQQYTLTIGYSYMASGFALTAQDAVYLRCTPQTDGSAVMQDIVQALPSSKDGKIYIHLGTAYSATNMELTIEHAVYWHDGTGIRLWTGAESGGGPEPSSTTPAMDGTAAVGTATTYARADHVHPTDTSRQATLVSGTNIKTINGASILGSGDIAISGGADFKLIPVVVRSTSNTRATVAIPDVGPDDVVVVFSSFANNDTSHFGNFATYRPYVEKNVNGNVTFKFTANLSGDAIGMLVAVISSLELQVFGMDSVTVSNRKPSVGETITVTGSGAMGTHTMSYVDTVTGETVTYATLSNVSTYTGSFVMPSHSVYLINSFSGGGNN